MTVIRPPAVAGQFYPAAAATLRGTVTGFLKEQVTVARRESEQQSEQPTGDIRAMIAPHAGYSYSGGTAAAAYARLGAQRNGVRRVLLVGPAHYVPLRGMALPEAEAFATPLGDVAVDGEACERLLQLPDVRRNAQAHAPEHSLEVHLPFLQVVLPHFQVVPLLAGACTPEDLAAAMGLFTGSGDLIVVSSDLSHFHDYRQAQRLDARTAQRIASLKSIAPTDACGHASINGLLQLARERGWRARTLHVCNSGDTGGPRSRVVGYGAFTFAGQGEAR